MLGFQPAEAWNAGEINPRTGRSRPSMLWKMQSGLDDKQPLEQHIASLLLYLKPKAEALRELWVDYDLTLQCVGYYPPSGHGAHFDREQIRQLAQLGIALDLDFYYQEDFDEH